MPEEMFLSWEEEELLDSVWKELREDGKLDEWDKKDDAVLSTLSALSYDTHGREHAPAGSSRGGQFVTSHGDIIDIQVKPENLTSRIVDWLKKLDITNLDFIRTAKDKETSNTLENIFIDQKGRSFKKDKLIEWAKKKELSYVSVNKTMAYAYDYTDEEYFNSPEFQERAGKIDFRIPSVIVEGDEGNTVVEGLEQLWRAQAKGIKTVNAYVVQEDDIPAEFLEEEKPKAAPTTTPSISHPSTPNLITPKEGTVPVSEYTPPPLTNVPSAVSTPPLAPYTEGIYSTFHHDGGDYSVDKLIEISKTKPVNNTKVDTLSWILKHTETNPARVKNADISVPIIVIQHKDGLVTLDGTHRLKKAVDERIEYLPTREITEEDLEKTRVKPLPPPISRSDPYPPPVAPPNAPSAPNSGQRFTQVPLKETKPDQVVSAEVHKECVARAIRKYQQVPTPTPEDIENNNVGLAKIGGTKFRRSIMGNSKDRKRRRNKLLKEFGDGIQCPCIYCGVVLGHGTLEQNKILTTSQGGRYKLSNIVPSCNSCNKRRGTMPFDKAMDRIVRYAGNR